MNRAPLHQVNQQLDRLFFQPLVAGETVELRADSIEAYLEASGWDWDSYLEASWMQDKN